MGLFRTLNKGLFNPEIVPQKGLPNVCAYSMSKFAVRGLVQSFGMSLLYALKIRGFDVRGYRGCRDLIAQELREYGICVNGYAPGTIQTDLGMCGCGIA